MNNQIYVFLQSRVKQLNQRGTNPGPIEKLS